MTDPDADPASKIESEAELESDISSDFAGLLSRVGRKPDPSRLKSAKARGKERAADQDPSGARSPAGSLDNDPLNRTAFVAAPGDDDAVVLTEDEEDGDDEREVVMRTEGLSGVDPREMLRKQLARGVGPPGVGPLSPTRPRGSRMGTG